MVVPHEGTWIEISDDVVVEFHAYSSFPTRERGLKSPESITNCFAIGRSPRGNVD